MALAQTLEVSKRLQCPLQQWLALQLRNICKIKKYQTTGIGVSRLKNYDRLKKCIRKQNKQWQNIYFDNGAQNKPEITRGSTLNTTKKQPAKTYVNFLICSQIWERHKPIEGRRDVGCQDICTLLLFTFGGHDLKRARLSMCAYRTFRFRSFYTRTK